MDKLKRPPPSLFAHNTQVKATQSVHAQDNLAKGILGRIVEALNTPRTGTGSTAGAGPAVAPSPSPPSLSPPSSPPPSPPYKTGAYSLAGIAKILDGNSPPSILNRDGVVRYTQNAALGSAIKAMNDRVHQSVFAETFATSLTASIESAERLGDELAKVTVSTSFPTHTLGRSFEQVAKVVQAHEALGEERQIFYVELGGFDTHNSLQETVASKFTQINDALTAFVDEMKAQDLWDQVALVSSSDFARTLGSNGAGTDHAVSPRRSRLELCTGDWLPPLSHPRADTSTVPTLAWTVGRQLFPHRRRRPRQADPGRVPRLIPRDGERQHRAQPPTLAHVAVGGRLGRACRVVGRAAGADGAGPSEPRQFPREHRHGSSDAVPQLEIHTSSRTFTV